MEYVVGLGSNLGSRENNLQAGLELLAETAGCRVVASSALYESAAVGPPQPDYLNAAARVQSSVEPAELLAQLLAIERVLGRERRERWGARTLDLDILWSERAVESADLRIPHPRLHERWFALLPLLEVAPELAPRFASLSMTGRRLHALAPLPRAELARTDGELVVCAPGLDRPDALAAVFSAAARALWPSLTCRECTVEVLRVLADSQSLPAALLDALRELAAGGRALRRVVLSAYESIALEARVFVSARAALADPFRGAMLEVHSSGATLTLQPA